MNGTEQCDDGNINDGDGCSAICTIQDLPPPSIMPSPPPPPPTNTPLRDYCSAATGSYAGCGTCAGKCNTVDNW